MENLALDIIYIYICILPMLFIYILVTGMIVGVLPGILKLNKMFSVTNMAIGSAGALVGAFIGFGDARIFLDYPILI